MFPSGLWAGFWQMASEDPFDNLHDLRLTFDDGEVSGGGEDMVGRFTMTGVVQEDRVVVSKKYVGMHTVLYSGKVDADGCIVGRWDIPGDGSGRFIWVPPGLDPTPPVERWARGGRRG